MPARGSTEARVYTPPLRDLTPDTSLGFAVEGFADDVLGVSLYPWQRWLLEHALEVDGDLGGEWRFRFRTVVVEVARQQGKTTLGTVVALFFLYVLGVGLVLGTAQDLEQAEDTWAACVEMAQENPELAEEIRHVWHTNGSKRLQLTDSREYRVKASTRRAGRGKSADLIFLDELREHQTWDAWAAITKTTIARPNALVWCMSNAGDATSVVLRHLRMQAHASLGDPDGVVAADGGSELPATTEDGSEVEGADASALGWFEWSAPPGAEPTVGALACANPSLGYGLVTERSLLAARATDPPDVFLMECMCQWVTRTVASPFPEGAWEGGQDAGSSIAPDSPVTYGVDVSADRSRASVCAVGRRADGRWHGELIAYREGLGWLQGAFRSLASAGVPGGAPARVRVAAQTRGAPVSSLLEVFGAVDGVELVDCRGADLPGWCGRLWDAVNASNPDEAARSDAEPLMHRPQPRLDLAAACAATRPMGDGAWAWDRTKSPEDASPLVALTMAFGAATSSGAEPPARSAYEDHDLMFI